MYAITNPRNLARVISTGCIGSRALYGDKYAPDGTGLANGMLPVWPQPPPQDLLRQLGDPAHLAIIEMDATAFRHRDEPSVVDGFVPLEFIEQLHFANQEELDAFRSTPFENVDPAVLPCTTTPHLFEQGERQSGESREDQPSLLVETEQASTGSLLGGDHQNSAIDQATVDRVDRILGAGMEAIKPAKPTRVTSTIAVAVWKANAEGQLGGAAFSPIMPESEDVSFVQSAAELLISHPFGERPTRQFLRDLAASASPERQQALKRAEGVMRGREALGSPADWDDLPVCALVMGLLVKEPNTLRQEHRDLEDAHQPTVQLALWFSGLLRGRARRPWGEREEVTETLTARAMCNFLNSPTGLITSFPVPEATWTVEPQKDDWAYYLHFDDQAVEIGRRRKLSARERLVRTLTEDTALTIADALGLITRTTVTLQTPSTITTAVGEVTTVTLEGVATIERSAEVETVRNAVEAADDASVIPLADQLLPPPEAP